MLASGVLCWASGFLCWASGFLCWASGVLCWASGFLCWASGFLCWASGFLCWASGFLCWASGVLCWAVDSIFTLDIGLVNNQIIFLAPAVHQNILSKTHCVQNLSKQAYNFHLATKKGHCCLANSFPTADIICLLYDSY